MPDNDTKAPAPEAVKPAEPKRYRNRTKVDQTIYLANGTSRRVPVGDTVLLDDATAQKHFGLFELVEPPKEEKKK